MLLMLLISTVALMFFNGGSIPYIGLVFVVVFYFAAKMFYNYLRNDDFYKNNKNHSSDMPGESYITKGESEPKKLFVAVWVVVILILSAVSLWLYSINVATI